MEPLGDSLRDARGELLSSPPYCQTARGGGKRDVVERRTKNE
jgi:hypothetical protein